MVQIIELSGVFFLVLFTNSYMFCVFLVHDFEPLPVKTTGKSAFECRRKN